jgi:hypothetical protein
LQVFKPQPKCTSHIPKWSWGDVHHPYNLWLSSRFISSEKSELENPGMQTEMFQFIKSKPPLACLLHEDFRKPFEHKQLTLYDEIQIKTVWTSTFEEQLYATRSTQSLASNLILRW